MCNLQFFFPQPLVSLNIGLGLDCIKCFRKWKRHITVYIDHELMSDSDYADSTEGDLSSSGERCLGQFLNSPHASPCQISPPRASSPMASPHRTSPHRSSSPRTSSPASSLDPAVPQPASPSRSSNSDDTDGLPGPMNQGQNDWHPFLSRVHYQLVMLYHGSHRRNVDLVTFRAYMQVLKVRLSVPTSYSHCSIYSATFHQQNITPQLKRLLTLVSLFGKQNYLNRYLNHIYLRGIGSQKGTIPNLFFVPLGILYIVISRTHRLLCCLFGTI